MTDDLIAKLRAGGFDAPPQSTLSSEGGLFALGGEQLAYLGAGGLQSVALREITRIHSDREGLLRVETLHGPRITASLIGFEPAAVQAFFNEVKVATNQAKNLPNSPQATPTGSSSWKSGWAVDPAGRPAGEPGQAEPAASGPAGRAETRGDVPTPISTPDATTTISPIPAPGAQVGPPGPVSAASVPGGPGPATDAGPAQPDPRPAGVVPTGPDPVTRPPSQLTQPAPGPAAPIRTGPPAPPEPVEDEAFEESVTVLPRPGEPVQAPAEPGRGEPVPTRAAAAQTAQPSSTQPGPDQTRPSSPAAAPTPVVISTAPTPAPRLSSAQPAPAAREVSVAPAQGSAAPSGDLLRQAEAVARFAGTLRLLAFALGLAAVLVGVLRFRDGSTVDGLWTLGTGVVGAFALLVFAQVAQLLVSMAGAGQRGE